MKRCLTIITLIFIMSWAGVEAQNGTPPVSGARGTAMGDASVSFTGISSAFANQAGLSFMEGVGFMVSAERRFLVSEINSISAAVAVPVNKAGTFGLTINYFGFSGYNERRIGLAYSRKLMDKLAIGAQFDYLGFNIPEYGTKNLFTFELGMQAQLIEQVYVGAHIFSPVRQEIIEDENVPTVVRFGISYLPSKKVLISAELEKDIEFPMLFKAGIEYYIIDILALRAGVSSDPILNSFGLGLRLKNGLNLDVASSYHYELGFTPSISISYEVKKKEKETTSK